MKTTTNSRGDISYVFTYALTCAPGSEQLEIIKRADGRFDVFVSTFRKGFRPSVQCATGVSVENARIAYRDGQRRERAQPLV